MWKQLLILLVVIQLSMSVRSKYDKQKVERNDEDNIKGSNSTVVGISAWGLIFLILLFIFIGVAVYYMAIFYPLLCKKERKYDRIELATV